MWSHGASQEVHGLEKQKLPLGDFFKINSVFNLKSNDFTFKKGKNAEHKCLFGLPAADGGGLRQQRGLRLSGGRVG